MTPSSFELTPSPSPPLEEFYPSEDQMLEVVVGNDTVYYALDASLDRLSSTPLPISLIADNELIDSGGLWARDNRVILHDGSHLVSHLFKKNLLGSSYVNYCLTSPHSNIHSLHLRFAFSGEGYKSKNREAAIAYATHLKRNLIQSRCCLEGGNIILFSDAKGDKKALIGMNSIAMSYLALSEERAFESPEFEEHSRAIDSLPLSDFFLIKARNLRLCDQDYIKDPAFSQNKFISYTLTPLLPHERSDTELHSLAMRIRAKWTYTQSIISKELGIPLGNLGWLYQEDFHIDTNLAVIEDCVFVDDQTKTVEILDLQLSRDFSERRPILLEYRKQARFLAPYSQRINELNRAEFERLGLKMIPIAGRFQASKPLLPHLKTLNFFNGILLPTSRKGERIYGVAPCPYPRFYENFFAIVRKSIPVEVSLRPLSVHLVVQGKGRALEIYDYIGDRLTAEFGGLRCMTNTPPQISVFSELLRPSPATALRLVDASPLPSDPLDETKE